MDEHREKEEAKTFHQKILEAENEIEIATSQLFRLDVILESICKEIKESLCFDFASISLISSEQKTIEAVYGIEIAKKWSGRAKHYLQSDKNLRDIQADIVQTLNTEIISGYDERFDQWVYEQFEHNKLTRVFTPILIIQDENGNIIENWLEKFPLKNITDKTNNDNNKKRQHQVFQHISFGQRETKKLDTIVIGTVEVGYQNSDKTIEFEKINNLVKFLAQKSVIIWKAKLSWVLEVIAEKARQIIKADTATLHFLYNSEQNKYIYEAYSSNINRSFFKNCLPRKYGAGRKAISEGKCKLILNAEELQESHPQAFQQGIKSLAIFPLQVNCQEEKLCQPSLCKEEGVLYIGFRKKPQLTEEELENLAGLFINRASDAIRHVMIYRQMRERTNQLATLHSVTQSLANISKKDILLRHIAWDTLNILAADVVTIYEYIQTEKRFVVPPEIAGRLKAEEEMRDQINRVNVPFQFLTKSKENVYLPQLKLDREKIFSNSPFANRESIKAVAGVKLKVGEEIVGVMFINYRRFHDCTCDERQLIETLASSAAIAIKNQRWLTVRSEIDRKLITTLDRNELLNLIVEQAVTLTGADLGTIRLPDPDPSQEMLDTQTKYPEDAVIDENRRRTSINEGITGWVAKHRKSALVDNVESEEWREYYQASFPDVHSELCVPLLDKDGHLLGVLNVESRRTGTFDEKHQQMLEALADQAVIGIQNVENKDRLVKMEAMAAIGELAALFVHRMNGVIGGIQTCAEDLQDENNENIREISTQILPLTKEVGQIVDAMNNLIQKPQTLNLQPINLGEVIRDVLETVCQSSSIILNTEFPLECPQVLANTQALSCIFENLIQNAIDAMTDGGNLSINLKIIESLVKVQVIDTGIGIEKKYLDKIFRPGYSTKSTQRRMGCGLWLAESHIKNLKGSITVESTPGQGTKFTVILPEHTA